MEPIVIDKLLMALSVLFTTPGNYIQLNSRDVNVSSLMRIGGDNVRIYLCIYMYHKDMKVENLNSFFFLIFFLVIECMAKLQRYRNEESASRVCTSI